MFYWKNRGFATDLGGRRTVLVKGPRTKASRDLAQQRFAALLASRGEQRFAESPSAETTVSKLIDHFLSDLQLRVEAGDIKPNTLNLYYSPYLSLIRKSLGNNRLNQLKSATILHYRSELKRRDLRQNTIKNHLDCLRTLLRWAKKSGYVVPSNAEVDRIPSRQRRDKIPTEQEIQTLVNAAPADIGDVINMLVSCAVRPGDLYALQRRDVDVVAGVLRLRDSKTGPRTVFLPENAVQILVRRLQSVKKPEGFVFTTVRGRPWTIRYFAQKLREIRSEAKLGAHVIAYSMRHYFTTNAFAQGLDLATVRALRGDRDARTTLVYEHLQQIHSHMEQAARQAVNRDFAAISTSTNPNPSDES